MGDLDSVAVIMVVGLIGLIGYGVYKGIPSLGSAAKSLGTAASKGYQDTTCWLACILSPNPVATGTASNPLTGAPQDITNPGGGVAHPGATSACVPYSVGTGTITVYGQQFYNGSVIGPNGQTVQDYLDQGWSYQQVANFISGS